MLWTSAVNASSTGCGSLLKTEVIKDPSWNLTFKVKSEVYILLTNISPTVVSSRKKSILSVEMGPGFALFFLFLEREENKKVIAYLTNMVVSHL